MANRTVTTDFWTDDKVLEQFSPEDKYFYLYLITNPLTNMSGCYALPLSEATHKTGYNRETLYNLLKRMENYHNVIRYDETTKEVLILNWGKYNWNNSPLVKKNVLKFADKIKNQSFKAYVLRNVEERDFSAPEDREKKKPETKPTAAEIWNDIKENPEMKEVMDYAESKGLKRYVGKTFYYYQERSDWKDSNGNPIRDWKKYFDKCVENGSIGNMEAV